MTAGLRRFAGLVDGISAGVGRCSALLLPVLMLVIVANVILRYGFGIGLVEFEELQWHLNAIVVLGCLAYAYRDEAHVRVDVWYSRAVPRQQALVEILGCLLLLLPFVAGLAWYAWGSFAYSFAIGESSPMPSGLPARYVIKFLMFAGIVLLGLQCLAQLCRAVLVRLAPDGPDAKGPAG